MQPFKEHDNEKEPVSQHNHLILYVLAKQVPLFKMNMKKKELLWILFGLLSNISRIFSQTSSTTSTTDSSDVYVGYQRSANSFVKIFAVPENIAEDSVNQLQIPFDLEIRSLLILEGIQRELHMIG